MEVFEKLLIRINKVNDKNIIRDGNKLFLCDDNNNRIEIVEFDEEKITYNNKVYSPTKIEKYYIMDYSITFILNRNTLGMLSSNIIVPPRIVNSIVYNISQLLNKEVSKVIIGYGTTKYNEGILYISISDYETLKKIIREEKRDRNYNIKRRFSIYLNESLNIDVIEEEEKIDYNLLIYEGIATGKIDIDSAIKILNSSENIQAKNVIINNQINKHAKWLIDTIQTIIDTDKITISVARELGNRYFGWPKNSISSSEKLMERILTEYGQNIIFGVPALINIKNYVVNSEGLPRSQFDLLLVNYLHDIEIVELKRPDMYMLEFDERRKKFFWSKDIAIAIGQTERYLSTIIKDNDDTYTIDGKKIKEFINDNVGGILTIDEITRPTAIIIASRNQSIAPPYKETYGDKEKYNKNLEMSYKELKASLKNIRIMTYTELIESVRLREIISEETLNNLD